MKYPQHTEIPIPYKVINDGNTAVAFSRLTITDEWYQREYICIILKSEPSRPLDDKMFNRTISHNTRSVPIWTRGEITYYVPWWILGHISATEDKIDDTDTETSRQLTDEELLWMPRKCRGLSLSLSLSLYLSLFGLSPGGPAASCRTAKSL